MEAAMYIPVDTGRCLRIRDGCGFPDIGKDMNTANTGLPVIGGNGNKPKAKSLKPKTDWINAIEDFNLVPLDAN